MSRGAARATKSRAARGGVGGTTAAGTGRASRGALTLRELGRWTSAGALTASVTAGAMVPLLGLARVRF